MEKERLAKKREEPMRKKKDQNVHFLSGFVGVNYKCLKY
jgi:hypothetical protein